MLRRQVRVSRGTFTVLAILLLAPPAPGQGRCPQSPSRWPAAIAVASIATAAAIDARADRHYVAHRTSTLDRLADAGNTIGAGHFVEPVLGAALLSSVLLRRAAPSLWRDALTVTIAYAVGNGLVGVLKPAVGRRRPESASSPWVFHPISGSGGDHSWPSSHVIHVAAPLAATVTLADNRAVDAAAVAVVGLVGWSRVYSHQHWTSDVVSTAVIGGLVARATVHWARHHRLAPPDVRCPPDGASGAPTPY